MTNLRSVKELDRSAGGRAIDTAFGEEIDHIQNHLHQIFTFVFVTGDALATDTLHHEFLDYVLTTPPHVWPNLVLVLDKYLATFCCDRGVCPNPMDARGVALQRATEGDDLLMRFYLLLGRAIDAIRVSSLPYWEYLQQARSWSADVWYSATDNPPPYLSSISTG